MRRYFTAAILVFCGSVLFASEFSEIDSLMKKDAAAKIALANESLKFAAEKAELEAEIAAADSLIAELQKRIDIFEKKVEQSKKNEAEIDAKIDRDIKSHDKISKYLDKVYAELSQALASAGTQIETIKIADFAKKTPAEKFRGFASLYSRAFAADKVCVKKGENISTGIFTIGSGNGAEIATIKVTKKESAK